MSEARGPSLLKIDELTLRFRGLTAVNAVDLAVKEGEIFAVIGPNGAGKTSLFNAITGIYEPSSGTVSLGGADLREQRTWKNLVRWLLVGLLFGVVLYLWVADVNQLWSAVIKNNYRDPTIGFQFRAAATDLGDFLSGRPRIERRTGRFYVVTAAGESPFGSSKTRDEAVRKRDALPRIAKAGPAQIVPREGRFVILGTDGSVLDEVATREQAAGRIASARSVDADAHAATSKRLLAFFIGLLLGTAAAAATWTQNRRTPTKVARRGIARTFQNIRLFQDMSVLENVLVGLDRHGGRRRKGRLVDSLPLLAVIAAFVVFFVVWRFGGGGGMAGVLLLAALAGTIAYVVAIGRRGAFSRGQLAVENDARAQALSLLDTVGLAPRSEMLAKNLPYGDQRRLEIARALATRPQLLLLDEPAAGMNPAETVSLMKLIKDIRQRGVTILLIEHHMRVVMGISDRIAVLVYGSKIAEGTPEEIRANPKVVEAYLGAEELG
jgi:ABC-type branched-subunit amino acid transport system ATPase component